MKIEFGWKWLEINRMDSCQFAVRNHSSVGGLSIDYVQKRGYSFQIDDLISSE